MLCQQSVTLGPVSSGSRQGSPKPLAGAPRWQPLVFMSVSGGSHPNPHVLAFSSRAHLLYPQGPIQQSPSRPPEGVPVTDSLTCSIRPG